MRILGLGITLAVLSGCAVTPQNNFHSQQSYQEREEISTSLFESDSSKLSNEAVKTILDGKIKLGENSRAALLKLPNKGLGLRYYGYNYWKSEDYMDLQQQYVNTLADKIRSSKKFTNTVVLPSFISSEKMSLPQMREAAVRMQAHLLVIYRIESDIFEKQRLFQKNQVKAFATCEVAVLDTRTGIIPFTEVITEKHMIHEQGNDINMSETRRRAEAEVSTNCLSTLGTSLATYLNGIP
jgi:hypothetical protein